MRTLLACVCLLFGMGSLLSAERQPVVLLISGSLEYRSDETLAEFQKGLEKRGFTCLRAFRKSDRELPGLEQLAKCDLAIFFTRRLTIEGEPLRQVQAYLESGKPVLGIRTASHGFQNYLQMDAEVFGGSYGGHRGNAHYALKVESARHPILKGVAPREAKGSLYKNPKLHADCVVLLRGGSEGFEYPVAWVRERKAQRIFYTSMGHPDDFGDADFVKLLNNAVDWCLRRE